VCCELGKYFDIFMHLSTINTWLMRWPAEAIFNWLSLALPAPIPRIGAGGVKLL